MLNKPMILNSISKLISRSADWYELLQSVVFQPEWIELGNNSQPNYKFFHNMITEYLEYCKTIDVPLPERLVYEKTIKFILSMIGNDRAYNSRFGGIAFKFIKDVNNPEFEGMAFLEHFGRLIIFWRMFEGRTGRNFEVYNKLLNYVYKQCESPGFYQSTLYWVMQWIIDHQDEFVYDQSYNPKNWYANCGVGAMDVMAQGGLS